MSLKGLFKGVASAADFVAQSVKAGWHKLKGQK